MSVDRDDIRGCLVDIDVINDDEQLDADESLFERGLIDSLGITILITHLEKKYGISVPQQDLLPDHFDSINAIADYVNSKLRSDSRE
jgi:acyl carrier protein